MRIELTCRQIHPTVVLGDTGVEEVVPSLNPQACNWDTSIQRELCFRRQLPISEMRSCREELSSHLEQISWKYRQ